MKVSQKQVLMLVDVLRHVIDINISGISFGYERPTLVGLYQTILNQQSNELVELEPTQDTDPNASE